MSENVPTVKSLRNVLIRALGAAMDGAGVPVLPNEEFDRQKQVLSDLIDALLADVALRHDFHRWLVQHDAKVWDEGQKSGLRYTDRMRAAYEIGRPELPGPPSENPYRRKAGQ